MRFLFFLLAFFCVGLVFATPVSADVSVSVDIKVTAVIAPARYIIIDSSGEIIQIISNTNQNVMPKVYEFKVIPQNEVKLSPNTYASYKKILSKISSGKQIGYIYKREKPSKPQKPINKTVNSIIFAKASASSFVSFVGPVQ